MSKVSITGDWLLRARRFPWPGRVIKSMYGTSPDVSFDFEDDPALSEENAISHS